MSPEPPDTAPADEVIEAADRLAELVDELHLEDKSPLPDGGYVSRVLGALDRYNALREHE